MQIKETEGTTDDLKWSSGWPAFNLMVNEKGASFPKSYFKNLTVLKILCNGFLLCTRGLEAIIYFLCYWHLINFFTNRWAGSSFQNGNFRTCQDWIPEIFSPWLLLRGKSSLQHLHHDRRKWPKVRFCKLRLQKDLQWRDMQCQNPISWHIGWVSKFHRDGFGWPTRIWASASHCAGWWAVRGL